MTTHLGAGAGQAIEVYLYNLQVSALKVIKYKIGCIHTWATPCLFIYQAVSHTKCITNL